MPVDWAKFQTPAAATKVDWGKFQAPAQEAEVINAQHPLLSGEDRLKITNLEDRPEYVARWLGERGFEVKEKDGELILRKGDDPRWYKVEKTGWLPNEWADIADLGNEAASIAAMTKGAAVGAGLAAPTGPGAFAAGLGGAAVGSASAEAARKAAAHAAGFRGVEDIGASAVDVGIEGVLGAVGEGVGRGVSAGWKAGKGAVTRQLAKRTSAKAAARAAPLGESAGEVAARTALAKKLQPKAPTGTVADDVLKQYQRGELRVEQVQEQLGKKATDRALRKIERPQELMPASREPIKIPSEYPHQLRRAQQYSVQDYDRMTTEAAQKALDPHGKLGPEYEFALPGKKNWIVPRIEYAVEPSEKVLASLPEANIREIAAMIGIRGAVAPDFAQGLKRPIDVIKEDLIRKWPAVREALMDKRYLIHNEINKAVKTVGKQQLPEPFEVLFREKGDGILRKMRAQTNAPVDSKPLSRDKVKEALQSLVDQVSPPGQMDLTPAREWAKRIRPKVERKLSKDMLRKIETADFDMLVEILYRNQKLVFKNAPSYDPHKYGVRWVWDLDLQNWRSISLDHVHSLQRAGGQFLDFSNPAWRQAASVYEGGLRTAGRAVSAVGRVVEYPARKAEQLADFLGLSLRGQARGAAAGAAAGYATTAEPGMGTSAAKLYLGSRFGGRMLGRLGELLVRDRGTAISRLIHRAPPAIAAKLKAVLKTLHLKGERAGSVAVYVALSSDPELAEWVHEAAEGLGLEPEVPEPAAAD